MKSEETKRLALQMYLEGMGFRAIGRVLNISYGAVYKWVKAYGHQTSLPHKATPIPVVELGETVSDASKQTCKSLLHRPLEKRSGVLTSSKTYAI